MSIHHTSGGDPGAIEDLARHRVEKAIERSRSPEGQRERDEFDAKCMRELEEIDADIDALNVLNSHGEFVGLPAPDEEKARPAASNLCDGFVSLEEWNEAKRTLSLSTLARIATLYRFWQAAEQLGDDFWARHGHAPDALWRRAI
jgi:hypothetical protein